jgi:signal transduction histidine kinase
MRLADFIAGNMEAILTEWQSFAVTLMPAGSQMTALALRDHAEQILQAVAKDLSTFQSRNAQETKSKTEASSEWEAPENAAQIHAVLRAGSGFDINQLAAEYRALRASVLRKWMDACKPDGPHLEDMMRFNEAIDQALAESIGVFSAKVEHARNLFLGMLGHDMRSPLQVIVLTASHLSTLEAGRDVSEAASLLTRSGARMRSLLEDLLEFNRIALGVGMQLAPANVDLAALFADELEQLRAAYPGCVLEMKTEGNTHGLFDGIRLQRLLDNLVMNAIKYGSSGLPIRVVMEGDKDEVRFEVINSGPPIDPSMLHQIFDPLKRAVEHAKKNANDGSLGLGLFIAREIAMAHGGDIEARSDAAETVFAVRLPRRR